MSPRTLWEAAMALLNFRKRETDRERPVDGKVGSKTRVAIRFTGLPQ